MKEQMKEQMKELTIHEWFASGQRVSCMFYSSLLDAEGRKEYVSCHLLEPPGGSRPSTPGLAPTSPMPTTQSAPVPSSQPGPMQTTESAPLSSPQPYNKESVTRQSIGARSKADEGQDDPVECITFLHGYPTCSYDYYLLVQRLRQDPNLRYRLLLIDMLGYGDSDKGVGEARFSIQQHANVVCAVWQRYDIKSSHLVVHDFAVSVAQELLYREPKNRLPIRLAKVFWLNGSVFIDLYRPPLLQRLCCSMLSKPAGWVMSQLLAAAVTQAFSKDYPPSKQMLEDVETSLRNRGGDKIHHKLIRFMKDRERYKYIWQGALELAMRQDSSRMMFYWGMQDPLSGAHVAAEIHRRYDKYNVRIVERPDLGHWPHLEDPDRVAEALIEFLQEPWRSKRDVWESSCRAGNAYHVSVRNGAVSLAPGYQPAFRRRSQSIDRGNSFSRPLEEGDRSGRAALVKAPPTIDETGGRGPAEPAAAPQVTELNATEAVKATIAT